MLQEIYKLQGIQRRINTLHNIGVSMQKELLRIFLLPEFDSLFTNVELNNGNLSFNFLGQEYSNYIEIPPNKENPYTGGQITTYFQSKPIGTVDLEQAVIINTVTFDGQGNINLLPKCTIEDFGGPYLKGLIEAIEKKPSLIIFRD